LYTIRLLRKLPLSHTRPIQIVYNSVHINVLCAVDWKALPRQSRKRQHRGTVYDKLKASVEENMRHGEQNDTVSIEAHRLAANEAQSVQNINYLLSLLKGTKRKVTEYNCILGKELANRKLMCYKNKCFTCSQLTIDCYGVFQCAVCNRKHIDFFQQFAEKLNCKKDWINFLIKLARLYMLYPKIKFLTLILRST